MIPKSINQRTEIRFDSPFKTKIIRVTFTAAKHVIVSEVEVYDTDEELTALLFRHIKS